MIAIVAAIKHQGSSEQVGSMFSTQCLNAMAKCRSSCAGLKEKDEVKCICDNTPKIIRW